MLSHSGAIRRSRTSSAGSLPSSPCQSGPKKCRKPSVETRTVVKVAPPNGNANGRPSEKASLLLRQPCAMPPRSNIDVPWATASSYTRLPAFGVPGSSARPRPRASVSGAPAAVPRSIAIEPCNRWKLSSTPPSPSVGENPNTLSAPSRSMNCGSPVRLEASWPLAAVQPASASSTAPFRKTRCALPPGPTLNRLKSLCIREWSPATKSTS